MQAEQLTESAFAIHFNRKKQAFGKLLTFLLIPLCWPVFWCLNTVAGRFRKANQRLPYDLAVATLEVNALIILGFFCFASVLASLSFLVFGSELLYNSIVGLCFIALIILLWQFLKRVFQLNNWQTSICLILFVFGYAAVLVGYGLISFVLLL